jgi:hypothetical protein
LVVEVVVKLWMSELMPSWGEKCLLLIPEQPSYKPIVVLAA